jgi:flagellar motor component MotA
VYTLPGFCLWEAEESQMTEEEEITRGNYTSAGAAVGGLGAIGLVVGGFLAFSGMGDPSMVEAPGMVATSLVLGVVGYGLWWAGTR